MKKTATIVKIALLKDLPLVGRKGQVLDVRSGFFRNFLAPNGLAVKVEKNIVVTINKEKKESDEKFIRKLKKSKISLSKISENEIVFERKAKKDGDLFGSVSLSDIKTEIEKIISSELPPHILDDIKPIKKIGSYTFPIMFLGEEIQLKILVKPF